MRIKISDKIIDDKHPTFVIAEGGINHNGKVSIAKKIIDFAKKNGADAVKFQTFKADDLVSSKSKFYNFFKKLELSDKDFLELSNFAKKKKIIFLSTPFSFDAVDLLERLDVPAFKIASGDLTNLPLIEYIASIKKPILLSTGMGNLTEVKNAIKIIERKGNEKIIIMHSVSGYPAPLNEINLKVITTFKRKFPYIVGFSDNGNFELSPLIAVSLGAKVIEKHFTINKKLNGPDQKISYDPMEMKKMVSDIYHIEKILGNGIKKSQPSELSNLISARRSIYCNMSIKKNSILTKEQISLKRPAIGILPKYYGKIIGKKVVRNMKTNEPIKWKDII